jgi:hypothetical protein
MINQKGAIYGKKISAIMLYRSSRAAPSAGSPFSSFCVNLEAYSVSLDQRVLRVLCMQSQTTRLTVSIPSADRCVSAVMGSAS